MKDVPVVQSARFILSVAGAPGTVTSNAASLTASETLAMAVESGALVVRFKEKDLPGRPGATRDVMLVPLSNVAYLRPGKTPPEPPKQEGKKG